MATGLENLWIYKLAEDLEVKVHEITKTFSRDEFYRSVVQLRRSSSSASNTIAEHYHKTTTNEKVRFLNSAKGETGETRRGILKSTRKKFLAEKAGRELADQYIILMKDTSSCIRFLELNSIGKHQNHNHKLKTINQQPKTD